MAITFNIRKESKIEPKRQIYTLYTTSMSLSGRPMIYTKYDKNSGALYVTEAKTGKTKRG